MSEMDGIKVDVPQGEKCAICGKGLRMRSATVFYFHADKVAGAWHAKCGPLPYIEGLTAGRLHSELSKSQKHPIAYKPGGPTYGPDS